MSASRQAVTDFLAQRTLAVAGASREGKKFGSAAFASLRAKGYRVIPVHPTADTLDGVPCVRHLKDLPGDVGGLFISVHPQETEKLVREAISCGIPRIWMQAGAESPEAITMCAEHNIALVHGECILMFAEPAEFFHRAHRFIRKVKGTLPR